MPDPIYIHLNVSKDIKPETMTALMTMMECAAKQLEGNKRMPRNMSFQLTIEQIKNRTKTVTRRRGWQFLKAGDELNAVNRTMGFKKGEHPVELARLRVKDVRREPINAITQDDVIREGFNFSPPEFVEFFCRTHRTFPTDVITRIEFEYV